MIRTLLLIAIVSLAASCEDVESTPDIANRDDLSVRTTFACGAAMCTANEQYCVMTTVGGGDGGAAVLRASCVSLPQGCTDCTCARSDARNQTSDLGVSCAGATTSACTNANGQITVKCGDASSP